MDSIFTVVLAKGAEDPHHPHRRNKDNPIRFQKDALDLWGS